MIFKNAENGVTLEILGFSGRLAKNNSRVSVRFTCPPLSVDETGDYKTADVTAIIKHWGLVWV